MANPSGKYWTRNTVAARGTGSFYFDDVAAPYCSIQVLPVLSTTTIETMNLYYSNVSPKMFDASIPGDANMPVTSSQHAYVWAGPDTSFTGSTQASSAFLTSSLFNLGNVSAAHLRFDVMSKSGGDVIVIFNKKG